MSNTHYIVMSVAPGYWGKAETIEQAIKNAQWLNAGDRVRLIKTDADAYVSEMGELCYNSREHLGVGKVSRNRKDVIGLRPE